MIVKNVDCKKVCSYRYNVIKKDLTIRKDNIFPSGNSDSIPVFYQILYRWDSCCYFHLYYFLFRLDYVILLSTTYIKLSVLLLMVDVIVGAPYEDNMRGAVYLYHGGKLSLQLSQKIQSRDFGSDLKSFGWYISASYDIDSNNYPGKIFSNLLFFTVQERRYCLVCQVHKAC